MANETHQGSNFSHQNWLIDPAYYLNGYLSTVHLICAVIGIPLNLCVGAFVLALERLNTRRNFLWIGAGLSNLFLLAFNLLQVLAVQWSSPVVRAICVWFDGLPCLTLFLNSFLCLVERYLCVKHSAWYKLHVTNERIVAFQLGSFLVLGLAFKGRHLFGTEPPLLTPSYLYLLSNFVAVGFVFCFASQMAVWIASLPNYPAAEFDHPISLRRSAGQFDDESDSSNSLSPFVRIGKERVSRMDLRAACIVSGSCLSLLILSAPSFILLLILNGRPGSPEELLGRHSLVQSFFYCSGLISVHCCLISPLLVAIFSRDINSALRERMFCLDRNVHNNATNNEECSKEENQESSRLDLEAV